MWMPALAALLATLVSGRALRARLPAARPGKKLEIRPPGLAAAGSAHRSRSYYLLFALSRRLTTAWSSCADAGPGGWRISAGGEFRSCITGAVVWRRYLLAPAAALFSGPLGEEIGWRGYLYPTLCQRMPERRAVVLSGVIWDCGTPLCCDGLGLRHRLSGLPADGHPDYDPSAPLDWECSSAV